MTPKLKKDCEAWQGDVDDVEVVNLAEDYPPVSYADLAPREFRKLNALHNRIVQNSRADKDMRLPKQKPQFEYASGEDAQLPFCSKKENEKTYGSEDDLPSPSMLLGEYENKKDPFDTLKATYQDENIPSSFLEDDLESPEPGVTGSNDSTTLRAPPPSPKMYSSFAKEVFDFDAYENDQKKQVEDLPVTEIELQNLKRERSPDFEEPEAKHYRVVKPKTTQEPKIPAWVDEFDPELIEGLRDIVDFVD